VSVRALVLAAVIVLASRPAGAAETTFGTVGTMRWNANVNSGSLGKYYSLGAGLGMLASYQPGKLGITWSLLFTRNYASAVEATSNYVVLVDMGFGLRFEQPLPVKRLRSVSLIAKAALDIVRSGDTWGASDQRSFIGPLIGGGIEWHVGGLRVLAELDYGVIGSPEQGTSVLIALGVGSH
jgi:hypothetical protein